VRAILVDTGPIVALLSRRDRHHRWAVDVWRSVPPPLLTCEAVLSEAVFLLRTVSGGGAGQVLEMVERGAVRVPFQIEPEAPAVLKLMRKYEDIRMDLADACLVRMAEMHADSVVMTIDEEFRSVYRRRGRATIPTMMPPR
jgi:predicted nucleic acid-binding protein